MKNDGFEVKVVKQDGTSYDRKVNNIADGHDWAKVYVESQGVKEATFYIDGKPQATYYGK